MFDAQMKRYLWSRLRAEQECVGADSTMRRSTTPTRARPVLHGTMADDGDWVNGARQTSAAPAADAGGVWPGSPVTTVTLDAALPCCLCIFSSYPPDYTALLLELESTRTSEQTLLWIGYLVQRRYADPVWWVVLKKYAWSDAALGASLLPLVPTDAVFWYYEHELHQLPQWLHAVPRAFQEALRPVHRLLLHVTAEQRGVVVIELDDDDADGELAGDVVSEAEE